MAHILIVEQDDILAELAAGYLSRAGHRCGIATNAAAAWRMIDWRRPDLLLLDEAMPDGDGRFLHRVCESAAFRSLPVLLLTTAEAGAVDGIGKPLQPEVLQDRVARRLESRPGQWAKSPLHHGHDDGPRKVCF